MGLLDKIKNDVKKSGSNKSKIMYFREGTKYRVRFLNDMDDGMEITFHDNYEKGINVPCQELFGRSCPYCDQDEIPVRTRSLYAWSVWDYEAKEVKLFMFAVNNCSPIPALMAMYETYGTLTDRDYVISVTGKQQNKTFSVVPMDKVKFRNDRAKPFSDRAILKLLDKAFPCDASDDDEGEEEEETHSKKASRGVVKSKSSKKSYDDEDDEDEDASSDWDDEDDEDDAPDYSEMSPKELYDLCMKRKIKVPVKKPAKFYINQLEEYDQAHDDWGEEGKEDDWEDEE